MPSRQAVWQKKHRELGLCSRCSGTVWRNGRCFACNVAQAFSDRGMISYARKHKGAWKRFVVALASRYERIIHDEGFMVDAIKAPDKIIELAAFPWCRGRLKTKVRGIISKFDDSAIRDRLRA